VVVVVLLLAQQAGHLAYMAVARVLAILERRALLCSPMMHPQHQIRQIFSY
jgi:hypothetical protein